MLSGHGGDGSVVGFGDLSVLSNFNDSTILYIRMLMAL